MDNYVKKIDVHLVCKNINFYVTCCQKIFTIQIIETDNSVFYKNSIFISYFRCYKLV